MGTAARFARVATGGMGFLAGYLWAVARWAQGLPSGGEILGAALVPGLALSAWYTALFVWVCGLGEGMEGPRGLRVVVAPAAFTVSFAVGAAGIRWALGWAGP